MVVLGRVLAPYGVKGWLKVEPFTESPEGLRSFRDWRLGRGEPAPNWQPVKVVESAEHSGNLLVRLEGCNDRDAALEFCGMRVAVPRNELPEAGPGEVYLADLVGLRVLNEQGALLGRVAGVFSNGAHEVLRVNGDGAERLVPYVPAYVRGVDVNAGVLRVDWQSDW
ncbi:MAG: 16S rRNA processing protein RimM [Betaproteobacteria bacterium]|nr:16S rRNA processing protein RimM [Betaproteobacteria bacterium]